MEICSYSFGFVLYLIERNRHVKIADKYGWDTLDEYLGNDLVYGPDDTARITSAQTQGQLKAMELTLDVFKVSLHGK